MRKILTKIRYCVIDLKVIGVGAILLKKSCGPIAMIIPSMNQIYRLENISSYKTST